MRPVRIGAPRGAQTLHPARVAHKRCCTLAAAILLAVRPASGVGPTVSPPGPLDQLKAGDGCISFRAGSICSVADERLEGFEAHPPGRGRYLLAGGTKLASSPGAEGPKLGDAARSGASTLVLPGQPKHNVFQPAKTASGKNTEKSRLHLLAKELLPVIPVGQVHLVAYDDATQRLRRMPDDVLAALLDGDVDPGRLPLWVVVEYETLLALLVPHKGTRAPSQRLRALRAVRRGWRVEVECGRARVGASRLTSPAHEVDHEIERPSCAGVRGAQG